LTTTNPLAIIKPRGFVLHTKLKGELTKMSERKLIWVDESVAKIYESMESDVEKLNFVNKVIADRKRDITSDIQNLSDDLIRFKAFALDYSLSFKDAYQTQNEALEKVWEAHADEFERTEKQVFKAVNDVKGLKVQVDELNKSLDAINIYKVDRLIDVIDKFNRMGTEDKRIFELILTNNKSEVL